MDDFDRVARRAIRDDIGAHLRWLLPRLPADMMSRGLLESQSAPRPGEPLRRCDTIFRIGYPEDLGVPWAAVCEVFSGMDSEALDRLGEYLFRFRREVRHGPHDRDRYLWMGVLLFLTDAPTKAEVKEALAGCKLDFRPRLVAVSRQNALATIKAIREDRLGASILGWVPLMKGGQTERIVEAWSSLCAEKVTKEQRRRELASQAIALAELTKSEVLWKKGLEAIMIRESKLFKEFRDEVHLIRQRENLARTLRLRFRDAAEPLVKVVEAEEDMGKLSKWFDAAVLEGLDTVRETMGVRP